MDETSTGAGMNVGLLWLKLNIYSLLLCFISGILLLVFSFSPVLYKNWYWYFIPAAALYCLRKAVDIFRRFSYKKEVFFTLLDKAGKRFDQRYFLPYMGSPCMRNVVFWSLFELRKTDQYRSIKKRFKEEGVPLQSQPEPANLNLLVSHPKIIKTVMENNQLKFITIEPSTGEKTV